MSEQQTEFDQIKQRLLEARAQLQANAPDWETIPLYKRPSVAMAFAEKQAGLAEQIANDTISIVLNIDARLRAGGL